MTRDVWQQALEEARAAAMSVHAEARTVRELAKIWQCGETRARHQVRQLIEGGRAKQVTKHVLDTRGRVQAATAYLLLSKPK